MIYANHTIHEETGTAPTYATPPDGESLAHITLVKISTIGQTEIYHAIGFDVEGSRFLVGCVYSLPQKIVGSCIVARPPGGHDFTAETVADAFTEILGRWGLFQSEYEMAIAN